MPGYYSGILAIMALNYNREAIISNCLSSDIQFIEGRKEALEQLDKEVRELNKANQDAVPYAILRFAFQAALIAVIALVLLYRE